MEPGPPRHGRGSARSTDIRRGHWRRCSAAGASEEGSDAGPLHGNHGPEDPWPPGPEPERTGKACEDRLGPERVGREEEPDAGDLSKATPTWLHQVTWSHWCEAHLFTGCLGQGRTGLQHRCFQPLEVNVLEHGAGSLQLLRRPCSQVLLGILGEELCRKQKWSKKAPGVKRDSENLPKDNQRIRGPRAPPSKHHSNFSASTKLHQFQFQ